MKTLACPECGVTFTKTAHNQIYCSKKCANEGYYKRHGHGCRLSGADAISATAPVSFDNLSKAKTRPANTSAVRWRIELRRRAMARRFGKKNMDMLPHPDIV